MKYTVKLEKPKSKEFRRIEKGLVTHNFKFTKSKKFKEVLATVRGARGELIGGCVGEIYYDWLFIKYLWCHEKHRGQGLGTQLLTRVEQEGKRRGCHSVWLDTFEYQARPFYKSLGYRDFGKLKNYPAPFHRYFLQKKLR